MAEHLQYQWQNCICVPSQFMQTSLNLNSLLVKRLIDNPSPGAVTGGN